MHVRIIYACLFCLLKQKQFITSQSAIKKWIGVFFLENKVYLSIDNASLAGREEMGLNVEQGIAFELQESC